MHPPPGKRISMEFLVRWGCRHDVQ